MPGIAFQNIGVMADHLLPVFLEKFAKKKIETDFTFQNYPMVDWAFRQNSLKVSWGGKRLEWRIQRGTSGDAIKMRPYQPIARNYSNRITYGYAPWGAVAKAAAWNERVAAQFTTETELIDYMDSQFLDTIKGTVDRLERSWWEVPESSADDLPFYGIPYWLPMLAAATDDQIGGFNGQTAVYGDSSTSTTIGNTDRSTVTAARTWAATHNGVNSAYLDTLRRAQDGTNYMPPNDVKGYADLSKANFRYFTSYADAQQYENLVNRGPDNRNGDANPYYGVLTFRGMMWQKVAALNGKANSPGYGINFTKLYPFVFPKYWMKWSEAIREPADDQSYYKRLDCQFQFACINEQQAGWVLHTVR